MIPVGQVSDLPSQSACNLRTPFVIVEELEALADWRIAARHFTVMPNHWHALLGPQDSAVHSLSEIMKRLKGRTAKRIRALIGGRGPFWQGEWFDRWVRDETEWTKMVVYIQNNPVKAGFTSAINEHLWTR